jgi:CheY-like chemotaxis protein
MLGVILGNVSLALSKSPPGDPRRAELEEIHGATVRSVELTRQLLAFARKQTAAPRVLDLNDVVAGMRKMLQRLIGEDIDLRWTPVPDVWRVRIDPSQIDQIMANLCVNARDAIGGVGTVAIETVNCTLTAAACIDRAECLPGDYVVLEVRDNGCGMDREIVSHLFEPFFTTKQVGQGTGLGLATVYGIVRQNQGFIDVSSAPGRGTTFRIFLPRYHGMADRHPAEPRTDPAACGGETILVVEDEPAILRLTAKLLEAQGYTVLSASTPCEALCLAEAHVGEISLVITDVVMPEMNGRDLAKMLGAMIPRLKRLFMSGYTADVIATRGVLDDGVHFIQKPFEQEALALKVREALDSPSEAPLYR